MFLEHPLPFGGQAPAIGRNIRPVRQLAAQAGEEEDVRLGGRSLLERTIDACATAHRIVVVGPAREDRDRPLGGIERVVGMRIDEAGVAGQGQFPAARRAGEDVLLGGAGNDTLTGGYDADLLTGGEGSDRFYVSDSDTITDFQAGPGGDVLAGGETYADGRYVVLARQVGADLSIEDQSGYQRALLENVDASALTPENLQSYQIVRLDDLERKRDIAEFLHLTEAGEGVRIFIGSENKLFSLSGSSLIVAPFEDRRRKIVGVLGVIGPTRMAYERLIPIVDITSRLVSSALSDPE